MAVSHVKSNTVADWTGTVTVHDSRASTVTIAATDLVRPRDWNSAHTQTIAIAGNTANDSTAGGTNVVSQGLGRVTLVGSTATLGISVAPGTATAWMPWNVATQMSDAIAQGTMFIGPHTTPEMAGRFGNVEIDRIGIPLFYSNASNSTGSGTISYWFGLYTKNASTLSLAYSTSRSFAWTFSGSNSRSLYEGIKLLTIPWTTTISANQYYVANIMRTTSGGAAFSMSKIHCARDSKSFMVTGILGEASNRSIQWPPGHGVYSVSTTGLPNSIGYSQIDGTSTDCLNQPAWLMINGTV